jgi:sulfatase modifying factor 1
MRANTRNFPLLAGISTLSAIVVVLLLQTGYASAGQQVFRNSLGMSFVLIPSGSFIMGSPVDEFSRATSETRHRVTITRPFYMQTTEVTVGQWRRLMGRRWLGDVLWPKEYPIAKVSWYDVQRFIKKLNEKNEGHYRLPTEAEWEYAARAGSKTAYAWGDEIECSRAMYSNSRRGNGECRDYNHSQGLDNEMPAPVKRYRANKWGLYDMHGNVWEWCRDVFTKYQGGSAVDPYPTDGTMRVRRGGSWFKHGYSCRSANRAWGHPASRFPHTGFRLVRETLPLLAPVKPMILRPTDDDLNQKGP